jgi:curved DNA-binding protein CbpA
MMDLSDARTILGVSRDCSLAELTKRYHIRALRLHPDKNGNTPDATAAFQELNTAYNRLLRTTHPDSSNNDDANAGANAGANASANAGAFETYSNIFMNFMKSLFQGKYNCKKDEPDRANPILLELLHRIVHDYASASVNSALDSLDPSVLFQLYETLERYNSAVSMDARIFEEITRILREKMHNNNIIILKPSLKDVIQNNISVVKVEGQTFYVPLWHSELHYRIGEKQIIVKCMPELPEHMSIDANNELHVDVRADIKELLNNGNSNGNGNSNSNGNTVLRIPLYDSECLELDVRELHIASRQTIVLLNNNHGISLICSNDIYDVNTKAPICVHVHLV